MGGIGLSTLIVVVTLIMGRDHDQGTGTALSPELAVLEFIIMLPLALLIAHGIFKAYQAEVATAVQRAGEHPIWGRLDLPPDMPQDIRDIILDEITVAEDPSGRPMRKSLSVASLIVNPGGGAISLPWKTGEQAAARNPIGMDEDALRGLEDGESLKVSVRKINEKGLSTKVKRSHLEIRSLVGAEPPPCSEGSASKYDFVTVNICMEETVIPVWASVDLRNSILRAPMLDEIERPPPREGNASPPPITGINVNDVGDAFEILLEGPPEALEKPFYSTGGLELTLRWSSTEVKGSKSGESIHAAVRILRLQMPEPLVPGSSVYSMDGTPMRIRVPKATPTASVLDRGDHYEALAWVGTDDWTRVRWHADAEAVHVWAGQQGGPGAAQGWMTARVPGPFDAGSAQASLSNGWLSVRMLKVGP